MDTDEPPRELDLTGSVAAVARVGYSDLATVVAVSVLFALASLPVVTVGAAMVALVRTVTDVVTGEGHGGPTTERERVGLFVEAFRANLRTGVPYTVVLVAIVATTSLYALAALAETSGTFLLGALVGVYATVVGFAWLLRTASIAVRAPEHPGFLTAARDGAYLALDYPYYTALHLVAAGAVVLVAYTVPPAAVLLAPGTLALLEVVAFEETAGRGAVSLVRAYRGEFE